MGNMQKACYRGKEVTIERVDAEEIREIAKKYHGSFNDDFGVYFILTTGENNRPTREMMDSPGHSKSYIGQGGVVRATFQDPNTGKVIFSGAELCDLVVTPAHQRQGYASLLTKLRLDWLKEQGYNEAFFPDCDEPEPITGLFEKLQREGKIKFERIYGASNPEGTEKSVYRVSNF